MTTQILDRRTIGIPGATGDVTPELTQTLVDAQDAALRADTSASDANDFRNAALLDAGRAEEARDRAIRVADSVDMDVINERLDGMQDKADGAFPRTEFEPSVSAQIEREAVTRSAISGPSQLSSYDGRLLSVAADAGLPRVSDITSVSLMNISGVARANWGDSVVTFTRVGPRVFVDGFFTRVSASGSAGNILDLGYVTGPFLPASVYGSNDGLHEGSVTLPATGMNGSDNSIQASIRIKASGYIDAITSAPIKHIRVTGSYLAADAPIIPAFDYPQFQSTYIKRWMDQRDMVEGVHFDVYHRYGIDPRLAVLAIHGGSGEAGSQELAVRIAELTGSSLYYHDMRDGHYANLHLDSNGFDDPRAVPLVKAATRCFSLHGAADQANWGTGNYSYVGGADREFRLAVIDALEDAGYPCVDAALNIPSLAGTNARNICNQGENNGVQIEMSTTLRRALFAGNSYSRTNRHNTSELFEDFAQTLAAVSREWV